MTLNSESVAAVAWRMAVAMPVVSVAYLVFISLMRLARFTYTVRILVFVASSVIFMLATILSAMR